MNQNLSWIDPARWTSLLDRARLEHPDEPLEETEGARRSESRAAPRRGVGWEPAPAHLDDLLNHARGLPGVEGAFVCDHHGLALASSRIEAVELGTVPALMAVFEDQRRHLGGPERGMMVLSLGGRRRVHLIETDTPQGRFGLGVVVDRTLPDATLLGLQMELARTVRPPEPAAGPEPTAGPEATPDAEPAADAAQAASPGTAGSPASAEG